MQSKRKRFQQWRGDKFILEQKYIDTAVLVSDYVDSVKTLEEIKVGFQANGSPVYKEFERFHGRSLGAVAFLKLTLDEFCEQLAPAGTNTPLYNTLSELGRLISSIYDRPRSISGNDVRGVFKFLNELLALDSSPLDKFVQEKKLLFAAYTLLQLITVSLNSLGVIARAGVSAIINIAEVEKTVQELLEKLEAKVAHLELQEKGKKSAISRVEQVQAHINQRYLDLLNSKEPGRTPKSKSQLSQAPQNNLDIIKKLVHLEEEMEATSADISHLIPLKKNKAKLEKEIKEVTVLPQKSHLP